MIEYTSKNGYTGRLYGKSSLAIFNQDGREVLHTGSRSINTMAELRKEVDGFPEFMEMLRSIPFDNIEDDGVDI